MNAGDTHCDTDAATTADRQERGKILFVVTEDWYFVSHRLALAQYLQTQGFTVCVATRCGADAGTIRAAGIGLLPVDFERSLRYPWRDLRALLRLHRVLGEEQPDVVHLVSLKPIVLGALLLASRHRRLRALWAFTGMGYIFSSARPLARLLRPLITRALGLLYDRARCRCVVQNVDDAALLVAAGIADRGSIRVIAGAGLDLPVFPAQPALAGATPLVVLPARLLRDKGIAEFAAAAQLVKARYPAARMVLAGRHDRDNHAAIGAAELERWTAEGLLEWWGHCDDMAAVYHAASMVCLPSYREGLPKVLLEAAACARALVASDVPGCREVCIDQQTGLLVPPGDAGALAAAILRLLDEPALAERLGAAARVHVETHFALPTIAAQTIAVYDELSGVIDSAA